MIVALSRQTYILLMFTLKKKRTSADHHTMTMISVWLKVNFRGNMRRWLSLRYNNDQSIMAYIDTRLAFEKA